jgi:hypothetical protein
MRRLLLVLALGCAAKTPPPESPATAPALTEVQLRACESCRHNLELCRSRVQAKGGPEGSISGPVGAECMDAFMSCITQQQLDTTQCQGMN